MAAVAEIRLPYQWKPRFYQEPLWNYLWNGGLRAVAVDHRRAGKDEISLHHTACAAHRRVANYVHMLPIYAQARKAIWDAVNPHTGKKRIDEAFPQELRAWTRDQEMSIGFNFGSTWQLAGSDNYNSLVGTSYGGMVFSEYALSNPAAWGYFSPILMENDGWAIFISTPRGRNHLYDMYQLAQRETGWYAELLTNDDTGVFTADEMRQELLRLQALHGDDYGRALWAQEYFCSFDAAIPGAIWADCIVKAETEGRIVDFEVNREALVNSGWDLGRTDSTAIWFYNLCGRQIDLFDYHESNLKDIPFYVELLRDKAKQHGIKYGTHWLPHDARPRTLAAGGKSILQQFRDAAHKYPELGRFAICKRLDRQEGIQAVRATLPLCRFHNSHCEAGIEVLRHYHREWDEELQMFKDSPKHDWASHGADAMRVVGLSWKFAHPTAPEAPLMDRIMASNPTRQTFGVLKQQHFDRMRSRREFDMTEN
jgi:hypothetical protein